MLQAKVARSRRKLNNTFTGNWSYQFKPDVSFLPETDASVYLLSLATLRSPNGITTEGLKKSLADVEPIFTSEGGDESATEKRTEAHLHLLCHATLSLTRLACETLVPTTTK